MLRQLKQNNVLILYYNNDTLSVNESILKTDSK